MATKKRAGLKTVPGFKFITVGDSNSGPDVAPITPEQRLKLALWMQQKGLKRPQSVSEGCTFSPRPVSELCKVLDDLSAQHSERLRQMVAEGRLVMG